MLNKYFSNPWQKGKLSQSWIINSGNINQALQELKKFIRGQILIKPLELEYHPDFYLVQKQESSRDITIDQIRGLQQFLYKKPGIDQYKVAIIYEADLMNLNAANSILKILEDTPLDSYIFLITTTATTLLSTIYSRCALYNHISAADELAVDFTYENFVELIIDNDIDNQLEIIKKLKNKDKKLWNELASHALSLISRIIKQVSYVDIDLNEQEKQCAAKLSAKNLMSKFNYLTDLISDTLKYDLDLTASFFLLVNELRHN